MKKFTCFFCTFSNIVIKKIWYAILGKRLLACDYKGHHRIIEPHVFGMKNEGDQLQTYQIGGDSSSDNLPDWRRLKLEEITNLEILDEKFPGRRKVKGPHSRFDKIYVIVAW